MSGKVILCEVYDEMFLARLINATKIVKQNILCYCWNSKRPPPA